ncbi:MAG: hypothetical protein GY716_04045 [bacterium]|nr:hypothetical protein [bacterium]
MAESSPGPLLRFGRKRVLIGVGVSCVAIELLLVFLDATVNYSHWTRLGMIRRLVNITREDALASWFGVTLTLMAALTLWLIWLVARAEGVSRRVAVGWLVLALLFSYVTVDDGAQVHERVGSAFKKVYTKDMSKAEPTTIGGKLLRRFPSYAWQIVFAPAFIALFGFMLLFLWTQLPDPLSRFAIFAALACFGLAVGLDFVEGLDPGHEWNLYSRIDAAYDLQNFALVQFEKKPYDALRHFSKSAEEFLEMLGMTLLWVVFLSHFMSRAETLRVEFR